MTKRTIGYSLALAAVLMGGLGTAAVADRGRGMFSMHDMDAVGPFDGPGFDFAAIDADKDGKLLVSDIATQIKWYTDNKMISGTLDAKDVANTSFLDEAMKK